MPSYDPVPTAPHQPTRSKGGTSGGTKTKTPDPYAAAQAKADAAAQAARSKAAARYRDQAQNLEAQAASLRIALGRKGFRAALKQKLANITLVTKQQDDEILRGYGDRSASLEAAASDNVKAADADVYSNLSNAGRERANALSQAMLQGAGESDVLAAQGAALRNWNANQSEIHRSFFDTQTSVNASLADLNTDTRTARTNVQLGALADREQLYSNYYDRRSETLTNLGNTYGQIADTYGLANEQVPGGKGKQKSAAKASADAFKQASLTSGKAWENPGVKSSIRNWQGHDAFDDTLSGPSIMPDVNLAKPEGASLRRWDA